jgi:hypothetical protein
MIAPIYDIECRHTKQRHHLCCAVGEWYAHQQPTGVGLVGQYVSGNLFRNSLGDYTLPAGTSLSVSLVGRVAKSTN